MPNGEDKNWVRACLALEGFYVRYGHWPTRLRFPSAAFDDLRHLFQPESLGRFLERFEVIVDNRLFAAESDGGRRFDYMVEDAFTVKSPVSAAQYFDWYPDAGKPPLDDGRNGQVLDDSVRYDLTLGGRTIRLLEPREVVREVLRFLLLERQMPAADINARARASLLEECAPTGSLAEMLSDPWLIPYQPGRWVKVDKRRDWSDYRPILYRLDAELPFGVVQWRETAVMQKADIASRLQLQSHLRRRRYVPPPAQATVPLPNSYRVADVPLFAGQCPVSLEELEQLGTVGIDALVDLRSGDEPGFSQAYSDQLRVERHRYFMKPGEVPSRNMVATAIMAINDCLDRGKRVYVHDKGGLGRSSVVLACLLVEWGLTPHEALAQIRQLAGTMPKAAMRRIPETKAQEQFVLAWTPRVFG